MVSWIVRAASWAFDSAPAVNTGMAIGCLGFAAPTIRMIGTDGIGASGGGVPPGAGACCSAAPSVTKATPAANDDRLIADITWTCLLARGGPAQSRVKVNSIWNEKLGPRPWGSGGKMASWIAIMKDRSTVSYPLEVESAMLLTRPL